MKIAMLSHLASSSAPTGAERSLAILARGLSCRGHEVAVTAPGRWSLEGELEQAGVPVTSIPVKPCWLVQWGQQPLWRQGIRGLRYAMPDVGARLLQRWLSVLAPDVVHVNCLPHLRGAANATSIVAVSEAVAEWLRAEGLGNRVVVVHNGVDPPLEPPDRNAARSQFGLPADVVAVGLFGQLVAHKGALDLVRAAHLAVRENQRIHFLIAGHGPASFSRVLEREIASGSAAGHVHVVPPQPEIWGLLAAVDVVALPTLWPDPLPRAVMEAMAAARPVVGYEDGGVPEMVADGQTGRLCRPGEVGDLARAILELAGDGDLRLRFGEAGRVRVRGLFSVDRHVERMESVFEAATSA